MFGIIGRTVEFTVIAFFDIASRFVNGRCPAEMGQQGGEDVAIFVEKERNLSDAVDVTNSLFERNEASTGGAVFSRDLTTLHIRNCTLVHNAADRGGGVRCSLNGTVSVIWNSILWDNMAPVGGEIALVDDAILQVGYSNVAGGLSDVGRDGQSILLWDEGNLDVDPLFAQSGYWDPNDTPGDLLDDFWVDGDYHLKSQAGRWDPNSEGWVIDDVTSPCVDTGDLDGSVAAEPFPNGGVINMGLYGGTAEASKSP